MCRPASRVGSETQKSNIFINSTWKNSNYWDSVADKPHIRTCRCTATTLSEAGKFQNKTGNTRTTKDRIMRLHRSLNSPWLHLAPLWMKVLYWNAANCCIFASKTGVYWYFGQLVDQKTDWQSYKTSVQVHKDASVVVPAIIPFSTFLPSSESRRVQVYLSNLMCCSTEPEQ